jgi:RecJ-like exonuclease
MKATLKLASVIVGVLTITGCAQNLWVKANAGQGEFERDRYSCLQQAQQRVGAAQVNANGGSAVNTVATNDMLFSSCMGSKGWSLQNKEVVQAQAAQNQARNDDLKRQYDQVVANVVAMCNKDELKEYYKKTACRAPDVSFEQIADTTKITTSQKAALVKQREEVALIEKKQDAIQRQRGEAGLKVISVVTNFTRPENEKNNLDLYNGKITWGDYNKRRKEIYVETQNKLRQ